MPTVRASSPTIAAVHPVLPPHRYAQDELTAMFTSVVGGQEHRPVAERLHHSAQVRYRHLALPLERYAEISDFGTANDAFIQCAVDLGAEAVRGALDEAGLRAEEVDLVVSTTVTGIAVPSIEARIAGRVGLRPDVKRIPMMGLGCVAGAAGIARLYDYLRGAPDEVAVLLSVELCSLTLQRDDPSMANLVASGLFGDGAAAVVAVGGDRAGTNASGPAVLGSRAHLYPDTERTMGWDVVGSGLRIVLAADVPELVGKYLGEDVREFLGDYGLQVDDVAAWVSHPGGPRVIEAMEAEFAVGPDAFALTWRSLADVGNLSSSSVLHVLRDTMDLHPPSGSTGLLIAMGPGFCSELVLLRWG